MVHLIAGLSQVIDAHNKSNLYWVHIGWTVAMLCIVILVWLGSFVISPLSEISAGHFLNLLAYAIVTSLMSGLLYPVGNIHVDDYHAHFQANRSRLYMLGIIFVFIDAIDGALEHYNAAIPWDIGQYGTLSVWMIAFVCGLVKNDKRIDLIIIMLILVGIIGWFASIIDTSVLVW